MNRGDLMFGRFIINFYKAKRAYEKYSNEHALHMQKMSEEFTQKKSDIDSVQNEHRAEFDKVYNSYFNLRNK